MFVILIQIAGSMVACTFLSAPFMFVSAKMITLTNPSNYVTELDVFLFNMSMLGLAALVSLWNLILA